MNIKKVITISAISAGVPSLIYSVFLISQRDCGSTPYIIIAGSLLLLAVGCFFAKRTLVLRKKGRLIFFSIMFGVSLAYGIFEVGLNVWNTSEHVRWLKLVPFACFVVISLLGLFCPPLQQNKRVE